MSESLTMGVVLSASLELWAEQLMGIPFSPGPDDSLIGHIGSCTVVLQDQQAEGYKVFSFAGDNSELSPTGLSNADISELKTYLGDPKMTTDTMLSHFEHAKWDMIVKYIEALKGSCALTS